MDKVDQFQNNENDIVLRCVVNGKQVHYIKSHDEQSNDIQSVNLLKNLAMIKHEY